MGGGVPTMGTPGFLYAPLMDVVGVARLRQCPMGRRGRDWQGAYTHTLGGALGGCGGRAVPRPEVAGLERSQSRWPFHARSNLPTVQPGLKTQGLSTDILMQARLSSFPESSSMVTGQMVSCGYGRPTQMILTCTSWHGIKAID